MMDGALGYWSERRDVSHLLVASCQEIVYNMSGYAQELEIGYFQSRYLELERIVAMRCSRSLTLENHHFVFKNGFYQIPKTSICKHLYKSSSSSSISSSKGGSAGILKSSTLSSPII